MNLSPGNEIIERIYRGWDDALSHLTVENVGNLLSFYAPNAVLESPLVPHLTKTPTGVLHGHAELRPFFEELARTQPSTRKFYRTNYLTDGRKLIWEYPRATPQGDQQDFVEAMEIENGLIQKHCVYWGWFGFGVIQRDEHHRKR